MDKYTTLLTNFLDARFWYLQKPYDVQAKSTLEYHEKALNDYLEKIRTDAARGAARASLDMPLM